MTVNGWLQIAIYFAVLTALVVPLGRFMARVFEGERKLVSQIRVLLGKCPYAVVCDSQPSVQGLGGRAIPGSGWWPIRPARGAEPDDLVPQVGLGIEQRIRMLLGFPDFRVYGGRQLLSKGSTRAGVGRLGGCGGGCQLA